MLDKKEFQSMASEMEDFDKKREEIIKSSRDVLKLSKQAVYDIHRNDLNYASKRINEAEELIKSIRKQTSLLKGLDAIGAFNASLEEWVEAKCYHEYSKNDKIPTRKKLGVDIETYLGALSDLTGELARRAVNLAIERKSDDVKKIRDLTDEIYGQFLKFNFRNGELRRKFDSIKWNLKKIEEVLYDLQKR